MTMEYSRNTPVTPSVGCLCTGDWRCDGLAFTDYVDIMGEPLPKVSATEYI